MYQNLFFHFLPFRWRGLHNQTWNIAFPVIFGSIAQHLISIIDTYYLGHVGVVELGAVGLANIWYFTLCVLGMGLGTGIQVMSARRLGENNLPEAGKTLDAGLILSALIGFILFVFLQITTAPILQLFCKSQAVAQAATDFLFWRSFDLPFAILMWSMRGFFTGIQENRILIVVTGLMALITASVGYVLIFGNAGFPKLGIVGAGIASMLAQIIATIVIFIYAWAKKYHRNYHFFRFNKIDKSYYKELVEISLPTSVQYFISLSSFFFFINIIEKMGEEALAVSELVKNIYIMFMSPSWGFSTAASAIVSQLLGMKKIKAIFPSLRLIILFSTVICSFIALALVIFPQGILSIFTQKADVINDSIPLMYIIALSLIGVTISSALLQAVIGLGGARYALWVEVSTLTLYVGYLLAVKFSGHESLNLYWIAEVIYVIFLGVGSYTFFKSQTWQKIIEKAHATPQSEAS